MSPFHRQGTRVRNRQQGISLQAGSWPLALSPDSARGQPAPCHSCQCLPEGLRWVAQPSSFQMLPAYPEARDQPGAPGGHAEEEGRCQSPSQKCLQEELRAQDGALTESQKDPVCLPLSGTQTLCRSNDSETSWPLEGPPALTLSKSLLAQPRPSQPLLSPSSPPSSF